MRSTCVINALAGPLAPDWSIRIQNSSATLRRTGPHGRCQWPSRSRRWWPAEVPTPRLVARPGRPGWLTGARATTSPDLGFFHPERLAGGGDDGGVVE